MFSAAGMGIVYQARRRALKRTVALKMMLAVGHAGPRDLARFRIEAEAVARLQHPKIVPIHEVGGADGHLFCALEFVSGGSPAGKIAGRPMPAGGAVRLVETLARGRQLAHSRNVVHRDLKPANVLMMPDGTPKICDFGLARQLDNNSGETRDGVVMGTPSSIAPEQAAVRAHEAGPAADIYSLGVIPYAYLVGRPLFQGKPIVETLDQVRPVGPVERAAKWIRRNPAAVAALVVVTALGVAGIVWKYLDAEHQRGLAEAKETMATEEADKATKARDFLVNIFRLAECDVQGGNATVRQIFERAEKDVPVEFAGRPDLREELESAIGEVRRGLGRKVPQAMILEVRGLVRLRPATGADRPAVPQALVHLLSDFHKERLKSGRELTVYWKGRTPADTVHERDDSVLMTFVRLPKGTFFMGWGVLNKIGRRKEIKEDFEIAVHDVTHDQWEAVLGDNPSLHSPAAPGKDVSDEELKLFPVENVNWDDVQEGFALKL